MGGRPVITLTTDFGLDDPFVGVMKGVIRSINPDVEVIDLTHGIRPQDIRSAAFVIGTNFRYFPNDSVHLVVVDPGVGSARRPLLVMTDHHFFIGPDNGVFSYIYRMPHEQLEVTHLTAEHYFLPERGATFHGRDVFAPIAAWVCRGIPRQRLGELIADYRTIELPQPVRTAEGGLRGEIIHVDRFGNAMANIGTADIAALVQPQAGLDLRIAVKGVAAGLKSAYSAATDRGLYALVNSADMLEFFVYCGSAAAAYGIAAGDAVEVLPA